MAIAITGICPQCGGMLRVKRRRADNARFISCARYPSCHYATDYDWATQSLNANQVDFSPMIKDLIFKYHPDRRSENVDPSEITADLNNVFAEMKKAK